MVTVTTVPLNYLSCSMKFYNRDAELKILRKVALQSHDTSKMTIITGRRRIGKTRLILESQKDKNYFYFFISRKSEQLLCEEFVEQLNQANLPVFGSITKFPELFRFLIYSSRERPITLVIDEFQEFFRINPSIYSDLQNIWDQEKEKSKMNLILSGSVYSLMRKIFEDSKEPLFGRANEKLLIEPFTINVQEEILSDHKSEYTKHDLLGFYIFCGGVPKYIEHFVEKKTLTKSSILEEILRENSWLLDEGKNVLIEEFGKEYTLYFSILSLIASGRTSRTQIESILEKQIGGYLSRLEEDYQIIKKFRPIFSKTGSRNTKYFIQDNFLNFWFRFIYKYKGAVELKNFDFIKKVVERDYSTFSGLFLERFIKDKLAASKEFSQIGSYWERGNQNEIDIVAINELEKRAIIGEVKLQKKNISLNKLESKAFNILRKLQGYTIEYKAYSLDDILLS